MITTDGERAKSKLWFAKKQLAIIQEIDVPAKATCYDGFTVKVWQSGELNGGRITSPAGAVVMCSTTDGIKVAAADYWLGAFTLLTDYHVIYHDVDDYDIGYFTYNGATQEDMEAAGYIPIQFTPMVALSPFGLIDGVTLGEDTVYEEDYSCTPGLHPLPGGEGITVTVTDNVFYDLNDNGVADNPKTIHETTRLFYADNGDHVGNRRGYSVQTGLGPQPWRILQQLEPGLQIMHHTRVYAGTGGDKIAYINISVPTDSSIVPSRESITLSDILPSGLMPAGLYSAICTMDAEPQSCVAIGSFGFMLDGVQTVLHVVNASSTPDVYYANNATDLWHDANPGSEDWKLFYIMRVGETSYVVDSSQFYALLASKASVTPFNWDGARRMLEQLAGCWPNNNWSVPYDAAMFSAHDGSVYTWTRHYGSVKFTTTGLFSTTINEPIELLETGVRPEIYYAGTFDETPLYLCICNAVKDGIKAVYYGSPFDTWTKLPGNPTSGEVVHVRPILVTPTAITLAGILKMTVDEEDQYNLGLLKWEQGESGEWQVLSKLPFSVGDADNFGLTLFGSDPVVNQLSSCMAQPPILPQMPVGPYAKYSIGLP